ncbi:alpha/beta hydrolase [Thalassotalea mangrovi]|uniref:Alpha/beta hydrolase fold-5 domain-containing protein n=1 Tax=Thalassotalea mangrovi TaxID=2572245 RepID=A0A4U1B5F6_9GAMM|nr:alpha/beta hydrolase [Thalassotalea mangrovi]TKB45338.1 hypothetical protein E8M12_09060 [Thalassotalea mangrovi]
MKKITMLIAVVSLALSGVVSAGGQGTVMDEAWDAMKDNNKVNVNDRWNYIRFRPQSGIATKGVCFVFYPGGLISPYAYAPYGQKITEQGYLSFILKVPVGLAVLEPNAANDAKWDYYARQSCSSYVIAGHSLGGAMAAQYVAGNPQDGLVLLGAYPDESEDLTHVTAPVASVYGSNDCQTTLDDINNSMDNLPSTTNYVEINGGNHPQFGWYGDDTTGNCAATVSLEEQSNISVATILATLAAME